MRCYFVRAGHINSFEALSAGDDQGLIEEAHRLFKVRACEADIDGFEVWDRSRMIYRHPERADKTAAE